MTGTGQQSEESKYFLCCHLVRGKIAVFKNQLNVTFDLITGNWAPKKGKIHSIWERQRVRKVFIEEKTWVTESLEMKSWKCEKAKFMEVVRRGHYIYKNDTWMRHDWESRIYCNWMSAVRGRQKSLRKPQVIRRVAIWERGKDQTKNKPDLESHEWPLYFRFQTISVSFFFFIIIIFYPGENYTLKVALMLEKKS